MNEIKLTDEQAIVIDKIKSFLNSNEEAFTLVGAGGTGKTFTIKEALRDQSNIIAAAMSHSAKAVLQESLGDRVKCLTIAQLLGLKQSIDEDGKIKFVPGIVYDSRGNPLEPQIANSDLILVDECSMIDNRSYNMIMTQKKKSAKVIFLGDDAQLPPIDDDESDSLAFKHTESELITPVRYTGPIVDLGARIRKEIYKSNTDEACTMHVINEWMGELGNDERVSMVNEDGSGYIFLNDIDKVFDIALEAFRNNDDDPDNMRMLAYRNKNIKKLNDVLRANLYGEDGMDDNDLEQFVPGELVICNGGYKGVIHNNQNFRVVETKEVLGHDDQECLAMLLDPMPQMKEDQEIYVVDYVHRMKYYNKINKMKDRAKEDPRQWRHFYNYTSEFAIFDYAYVQSVHKSQGKTYQDVIVFESDIMNVSKITPKAKLQALYVACTRAKRRVYIYNNRSRNIDQSRLPTWLREELGI